MTYTLGGAIGFMGAMEIAKFSRAVGVSIFLVLIVLDMFISPKDMILPLA